MPYKDKAQKAAAQRRYYAAYAEEQRAKRRAYYAEHKDECKKTIKSGSHYAQRVDRKYRRNNSVPPEYGCALCESHENLEKHHSDYDNDTILWLCRRCHRSIFDVAKRSGRICLLSDVSTWTAGNILGLDS